MSETLHSNIGIIHLSDLHFSSEADILLKREDLLFQALKDNFLSCTSLYIVISGDIANAGKKEEYEIALNLFSTLEERLKQRYPETKISFIIVPGNHDCDFDLDTQDRINSVRNVNYETIGADQSVIKKCLHVQSEYWNFYSLFDNVPSVLTRK